MWDPKLLDHQRCPKTDLWPKLLDSKFRAPWASLVAQSVKSLPAVQEMWVQSLGQEDPQEKGMATRPSVLAWRIPRTEEPGHKRVGHDWVTNTSTFGALYSMWSGCGFGLSRLWVACDTEHYHLTVTSGTSLKRPKSSQVFFYFTC